MQGSEYGCKMNFPDDICGHPQLNIRDAFKAFLELDTPTTFKNGIPRIKPKRMTPDFLAAQLNIDRAEAGTLITCLKAEGWLEADRPVPTTRAMALAQHIVRPRILRAKADEILTAILDWAETFNNEATGDIRIKELLVFGSYTTDAPTCGDIDLIVVTNYADLTAQDVLQPEHNDEVDDAVKALQAISEYISPADEMDMLTMPDVKFTSIYRWGSGRSGATDL